MVIYYPEWGYRCCGDLIRVGDEIEEIFVSELTEPLAGADLYYDGHIVLNPESSFFVDGMVERIQAFGHSDRVPKGMFLDIPDTDAQIELDKTVSDEWEMAAFVLTVRPVRIYPLDNSDE